MSNKSYNNLNYISYLKKIKKINILNLSKNKNITNIYKKKISEKNIISTCMITGNKKKIQKNIKLNRHFIRSIYLKKEFLIWNKLSW